MVQLRLAGVIALVIGLFGGVVAAQPQPAPPSGRDVSQQLDELKAAVNDLSKQVEDNKSWSSREMLTAIAALLAALFSGFNLWLNRMMGMRILTQKVNEEKAKSIQERLDKFYGPLVQLRNQSKLLYKAFKARQPDPDTFRTLTALLSGKKFDGNDKVLLEEIIRIGKETETLVMQSSGLVDVELQRVLGKATTHYLVLRLAHEELLKGDAQQFEEYVFPRELDEVIEAKITELNNELQKLRTVS